MLILHGTVDKATKPGGSQFFYDTAGSADKTLKLYEGHYHDLLADVGEGDGRHQGVDRRAAAAGIERRARN